MDDQLHILIMGDRGKTFRMPCSRKKLAYSGLAGVFILLLLIACSSFSISLFTENKTIAKQLADLRYRVKHSDEIIANFKKQADAEKMALSLEVTNLKLKHAQQQAAYRKEKQQLLSTAVNELNERSELIEQVMSTIGVQVEPAEQTDNANKGGPFIPAETGIQEELLDKADKYLDTIRFLPLGKPIPGPVTSRFGKRNDPLNKKRSIHEGVDLRGRRGEKIYATAEGVVKKAFKNGGYGNYLEIDHQNGYITAYAHMQSFTVHKGEKISRGQLIGLVGNTGRSTGPHLHYEIRYKNNPVNPTKYMQVVKLLKP